jgi:(p)ppGpp synthase/HD superfamily hydrolase
VAEGRGLDDLVLRAMRLAEYVHRNRPKGPHHRKAPPGRDRPPYFIHLAEVGWMLQESGLDSETVAAGFLHDIIEDCDYTQERLAREIGNERVAELVAWVSESSTDPQTGEKFTWEERNRNYLERMHNAPPHVLALSCADKTANILDMCRHMKDGHPAHTFTSRGHATQLAKFEALGAAYENKVPPMLALRYRAALDEFRRHGGGEGGKPA